MGGLDVFKDTSFLLKFIAMVLNIVALVFWVIGKDNVENLPIDKKLKLTFDAEDLNIKASGLNFSQLMLFYHCVPAFTVILIGLVVLYLLGEEPGKWAQRVFGLTGAILFLVFGVLGLVYALGKDRSSHELVVAALCTGVGGLLCFDFIKREFL